MCTTRWCLWYQESEWERCKCRLCVLCRWGSVITLGSCIMYDQWERCCPDWWSGWKKHAMQGCSLAAWYVLVLLSMVCCEFTLCTVCLKKNDIDVAHRNSDADQPILVIFGGDVAERAYYQILFVIPPLLANVSALTGETWNPEIVSFQSWCKLCLKNKMAR